MKRSFQSLSDEQQLVYDTGDDSIKPAYYREGGLRKVEPYFFEYRSFAKARWVGRSLLDVFTSEFRDRPARYYGEAMRSGLIQVYPAGRKVVSEIQTTPSVALDYLIRDRDLIVHRMHRHEPPVLDRVIEIVHREEDLLVVNKPASIPVHPSGRYRYNTLVEHLKNDPSLEELIRGKTLSLINRLDRPTSGLVLIALNYERAEGLHRAMESRMLRKEYICRVIGKFPNPSDLEDGGAEVKLEGVSAEAIAIEDTNDTNDMDDRWISCNVPLRVVEHKLGLVAVDRERGKPSKTLFQRISYSPQTNTSLVQARPLTGRTHQIRVHLQYLGHPILNDHLYNRPEIWASEDERPAGGAFSKETIEHARTALMRDCSEEYTKADDDDGNSDNYPCDNPDDKTSETSISPIYCPDCINPPRDPDIDSLQLYLHAYRYSSIEQGWSYSTELPEWAKEDHLTASSSSSLEPS